MLSPCQGGNKHQKRGFRQMKIRDQAIQNFKAITRVDKNFRPAAAWPDMTIVIRRRFDRPAAGSADTNNAPAILLRPVDLLCCLFINLVKF